MPYYMDLHVVPGITPEMMAEGHREDLKVQAEFNCKCITYWLDADKGRAFCLAEAPNKESLKKTHLKALGIEPLEIIEVDKDVVKSFLGRIKDPEMHHSEAFSDLKIFNDPAFRIVLACETEPLKILEHQLGKPKAHDLSSDYRRVVQNELKNCGGLNVKGEEFLISFRSVFKAVECSLALYDKLKEIRNSIGLKMSIHAGLPVQENDTLFGEVVRFAKFCCKFSSGEQIIISPIVRQLYKAEYKKLLGNKGFRCVSSSEEIFIDLLIETLQVNWQNPDFSIIDFCEHMSMSKSQLFRKSKSITSKSPNILLQEYRLQKSLELLNETEKNISEVAFDCGFNSLSYFTKCFRKRFGIQPTSYLKAY